LAGGLAVALMAAHAEAASTVDREAGGVVRVESHTDSKGSPGYNQPRSERRARSVERALSRLVGERVSFRIRGQVVIPR
jgi:outer membrane protein OmpA-like peptidoglycan-associated protein